jgi:hypothetical protein
MSPNLGAPLPPEPVASRFPAVPAPLPKSGEPGRRDWHVSEASCAPEAVGRANQSHDARLGGTGRPSSRPSPCPLTPTPMAGRPVKCSWAFLSQVLLARIWPTPTRQDRSWWRWTRDPPILPPLIEESTSTPLPMATQNPTSGAAASPARSPGSVAVAGNGPMGLPCVHRAWTQRHKTVTSPRRFSR